MISGVGQELEDHISNLRDAVGRFRSVRPKTESGKMLVIPARIEFLGRQVTGDRLAITARDTETVSSWPKPNCSKDVERFMGLANHHRNFVKNFAELAEPLYRIVGKNNYQWADEQEMAFNALKMALTTPPVVALPNHRDEYILDTDASDISIGAELIQVQNGEEKVIAYGSFALTKEQRK